MYVLTLGSSFRYSLCCDDRDDEVYVSLIVSVVRIEGEECVDLVFRVFEVIASALLDALSVST